MTSKSYINVMISSRCNDDISDGNGLISYSEVRKQIQKQTEDFEIFGQKVFKVWINETSPPIEGSRDSWDACLDQVDRASIVIVLYNGRAGWCTEAGGIGICHAEIERALSTAPGKVFLIELPLNSQYKNDRKGREEKERDERFRQYVSTQSLFRGQSVTTAAEAILRTKETLVEALLSMVKLGKLEAKRGKYHLGEALEWSRLDYQARKTAIESTMRDFLRKLPVSVDRRGNLFITVRGSKILVISHGVPAAMSISAAKEMLGQPFIYDFEASKVLGDDQSGPVHIIGCHRNVTENQAMSVLGVPNATVVTPPFGVYVADEIQNVQLFFISNCRDDASTRHGLQRLTTWLEQSGETDVLLRRAEARAKIVKTIAEVVSAKS